MPLPVLFLGHGNPMNAITDSPMVGAWRALGRRLPRPKALLVVSAHWITRGPTVSAAAQPETIHDFSGFPPELFAVRYPAPGDPVRARALAARIPGLQLHPLRGLDHGAWSVLRPMFPAADLPTFQLSLDGSQGGAGHLALGAALRPLRDEGVLIIASGNIVHNLRQFSFSDPTPVPWALRARDQVNARLRAGDVEALGRVERLSPDLALAAPTPEHFLPLLVALGAAGAGSPFTLFNDEVISSLSMTSVIFGAA